MESNGTPDLALPSVRSEKQLRPLHDQVIVRQLNEDYTVGGIVIPVTENSETAPRGEVVAVGPGRASEFDGHLSPMSVKPGDIVYITPDQVFSKIAFMCGSEMLFAIRDRELIIAIDVEAA